MGMVNQFFDIIFIQSSKRDNWYWRRILYIWRYILCYYDIRYILPARNERPNCRCYSEFIYETTEGTEKCNDIIEYYLNEI